MNRALGKGGSAVSNSGVSVKIRFKEIIDSYLYIYLKVF